MARNDKRRTDLELFQAIALSLATEELQQGLDILLTIALSTATEDGEESFNLLAVMGYDEYDIACVTAAHAWIKRVTGMTYDVAGLNRFDKRKKATPHPDTRDFTIDDVEEG